MTARELRAFINERPVGVLREDGDLWAFAYDRAWVGDPDGYALSPALPRQEAPIVDGSSVRPVQWYFDNLLPEEGLRTIYAREAKLASEDTFGLLAYFGAESAGSLTLLAPGVSPVTAGGRRELDDAALSLRIRQLPQVPLIHDAPKRMSVAGAQHKLLVIFDGKRLFEPLPGSVSTHLLKPNHPDDTYPSSVINEYYVMRLAQAMRLTVPRVFRRYVPEPVYLVERFDRIPHGSDVLRVHVIDSCQLLNRARSFKYAAARLDSLDMIAAACRAPAAARLWLYRWLVFSLLVGNADNHLKNISATVSAEGIELAPAYDLLSTAVYATRAFSDQPTWPDVELALPLPGATHFAQVTRKHLHSAAGELGVPLQVADRELGRLVATLPTAASSIIGDIERENAEWPEPARVHYAGELRLVRAIERVVIADMVQRLN